MDVLVAVFMAVMGIGIVVIWTADIRAGRGYETSGGLWRARAPVSGERLALHWLAEYGTALALLVGGAALVLGWAVAEALAAAALGALAYTSVNSLAWVLARPERRAYGFPMLAGAVGAALSLVVLLLA